MSLEINENLVNAVLLPDGWHEIKCGSFFIDAYEYRTSDGDLVTFSPQSGVSYQGFCFIDNENAQHCGPLTAVHAIRETQTQEITA